MKFALLSAIALHFLAASSASSSTDGASSASADYASPVKITDASVTLGSEDVATPFVALEDDADGDKGSPSDFAGIVAGAPDYCDDDKDHNCYR